MFPRHRGLYFLWIVLVIATGLACRFWLGLPWFWAKYSGDALWALMFFFVFAWLWPAATTVRIAILTCAFSLAIECSQLYHAPRIDAIRATWLGRLLLGEVFGWGDLLAYLSGIAIGAGLECFSGHFAGQSVEKKS